MSDYEIWEYARDGNLEGAQKRVELKGKDIINTEKHSGGSSALTMASCYGHLPIVQYLISHGANINDKDCFGRIALHCACGPIFSVSELAAIEIIKTLIANGATETIRTNDNYGSYSNKTPAEYTINATLRNALNQAVQDKRNGRLESYVLSAVDVSEKVVEKVIERAIVTPVTSVTTTTITRRGRKPNVVVESEAIKAPIEAASSVTATSRRRPAKEQAITQAPVSSTRSKRTASAARLDNTTSTSTATPTKVGSKTETAAVVSPIVKKSRLAAANPISEAKKSTRTRKSSSSKSSNATKATVVEEPVKRYTRSSRK